MPATRQQPGSPVERGAAPAVPLGGVLAGLAWLAGLALLQGLPRLPEAWQLSLAVALGAALVLPAWRWRRARLPLLLLAVALLAFGWAAWRAQLRLAEALDPAWEGRDLWLVGRIDSLPQPLLGQGGAPGLRFAFALESAADPDSATGRPRVPRRLLLSAYASAPGEALPDWHAGQRWRLLARLRQPHGQVNPHGFDYELHLFEQGLRATGQLRRWQRLDPQGDAVWHVDRSRQALRGAIRRAVEDPGRAGVLAALSLGEQAAIARADWSLFRDTGTSHLMAISGVHITMLAWGARLLAARLWRLGVRTCLLLPAPGFGLWAGVAVAWLYALFSGWGVPAQRTVWMLLVLALLRQLGLRWPWPLCLLAAACAVSLLDPWAVVQPGFWLSFVAVGLLMAGGEPGPGWRAQLRGALRSQWVATLGLAPLTLLFFQQLSLVGLAANLLAIPLVSLLITPLALAGALVPALWQLADLLLAGLMGYLRWLVTWPGAVLALPAAPGWAQALGLLGAAVAVLPWPGWLRWLGLPLVLPLLWPALPRPAPGQFELLAADVGQGTAVLVRTARHALLYDSGPQYTPQADAGQRVLLPLLRALGQRQLDLLLLSHRDQDHVGGAAALLAGLPVRGLLSSLEPAHPLQAAGPPARRCERGLRWQWDGVSFELLHPAPADYARPLKPNALSCVLRIVDARGVAAALLPGDIEAPQELALAARGDGLRADLLLLPHHGSAGASSEVLLDAVAPSLAFAQAGYRNRFGHPAPAVAARLQARGVPLLASPDCGALRWDSASRRAACQRDTAPRYWQRRPLAPAEPLQGPPEPVADQGF